MVGIQKPGKRLVETDLCDERQLRKLAMLPITTCEELVSVANDDQPYFRDFLGVGDMNSFLNRVKSFAVELPSDVDLERLRNITYSYGRRYTPQSPGMRTVLDEEVSLPQQFFAGISADVDLRQYFGPIRDQGNERLTCMAFGAVAAREFLLSKYNNNKIDLSEQFLYWVCKRNDGDPNVDGTSLTAAFNSLATNGVCDEATLPYKKELDPRDISQGPPRDRARIIENLAEQYKLEQGQIRNAFNPGEGPGTAPLLTRRIANILDRGSVVAVAVNVCQYRRTNTFDAESVKITGNILMPKNEAKVPYSHALCLVGYGFSEEYAGGGYFIVRNSWGENWGIRSQLGIGYGTIPFNYIKNWCAEAFYLSER